MTPSIENDFQTMTLRTTNAHELAGLNFLQKLPSHNLFKCFPGSALQGGESVEK